VLCSSLFLYVSLISWFSHSLLTKSPPSFSVTPAYSMPPAPLPCHQQVCSSQLQHQQSDGGQPVGWLGHHDTPSRAPLLPISSSIRSKCVWQQGSASSSLHPWATPVGPPDPALPALLLQIEQSLATARVMQTVAARQGNSDQLDHSLRAVGRCQAGEGG
jgi:hypothetical protein